MHTLYCYQLAEHIAKILVKIIHQFPLAEKLDFSRSNLFNCFNITLSLAWLTLVFGILSYELLSKVLILELLSSYKLDLFANLFSSFLIDLGASYYPIASATSFTGKLKAARYYFLDSTCWVWNLFISSISRNYYSYSSFSCCFFFYFCSWAFATFCAWSI